MEKTIIVILKILSQYFKPSFKGTKTPRRIRWAEEMKNICSYSPKLLLSVLKVMTWLFEIKTRREWLLVINYYGWKKTLSAVEPGTQQS